VTRRGASPRYLLVRLDDGSEAVATPTSTPGEFRVELRGAWVGTVERDGRRWAAFSTDGAEEWEEATGRRWASLRAAVEALDRGAEP